MGPTWDQVKEILSSLFWVEKANYPSGSYWNTHITEYVRINIEIITERIVKTKKQTRSDFEPSSKIFNSLR